MLSSCLPSETEKMAEYSRPLHHTGTLPAAGWQVKDASVMLALHSAMHVSIAHTKLVLFNCDFQIKPNTQIVVFIICNRPRRFALFFHPTGTEHDAYMQLSVEKREKK